MLQGTLDLMVLQTLDALGPLHGYGIARRIEQISDDALKLKEGTVYASLVRLQQNRCIRARWAPSDNNRKASSTRLRAGAGANWPRKRETGSASPAPCDGCSSSRCHEARWTC